MLIITLAHNNLEYLLFIRIKIFLNRQTWKRRTLFKTDLKTSISFAAHFMWVGRWIKILIPPFWYLVKLVMGRWKLLADLVSWLWTSRFFVNKCWLYTVYNKSENIYWEKKGEISIVSNISQHESIFFELVIILKMSFFAFWIF